MFQNINVFPPINISMRVYFSSYHLWTAKEFCDDARYIEETHTGRSKFDIKHRALVTSSVLSSAAFMEAAINELFKDAYDGHLSYIKMLPENKIQTRNSFKDRSS